jgi:hypothetical protein
MSTDYGGIWSATNPEFDTIPTVNDDHKSAAHAGSGGGVLENNILASPTQHLSPINILKNEYLMLDDICPPTVLKICGTDFLDHILITAIEYNYLRFTISNNEKSQEIKSESDNIASNNDYKSAFYIDFDGEISKKKNLKFDFVFASTIDNKFIYFDYEILNLIFDKFLSIIYKESDYFTDFNKENLIMKKDCRLNLL